MRIVSLAPSNTEILFRIGKGEEVVATTSLCDHPEKAREKPSIGGWTNPKMERVESFEPDLIIASDDLQDKAVDKLEDRGFNVLQLKPHSLEEVFQSIRKIGRAVKKEQEAEKLVEEMKTELDSINLENTPKIYCEEWMDPPMVSGNWIPGLIQRIGGNYFIKKGRSREFKLEKLKQFDPEYIFMNVCGAGENLNPAEIMSNREEWQEITAVKKGNVYKIDDSLLNRPSHRLTKGARKIAEIID